MDFFAQTVSFEKTILHIGSEIQFDARQIDIFVKIASVMRKWITMVLCLLFAGLIQAQPKTLQPGFDAVEYAEMLGIIARQVDTPWTNIKIPLNDKYRLEIRSQHYRPDNRWDLWVSSDSILVLDMHATTGSMASWMENYYAAMIPAKGTWKITDSLTFDYCLSDVPGASVHSGWMCALGFMAADIKQCLDSYVALGYSNIIITGHSQGGALACLFTAWLRHLQVDGKLPGNLIVKTYCSAAPKPGNQYFAWDYTAMTQHGWAFNVINPYDWVPETPFSLQTTRDMNPESPFGNIKTIIRHQRFPMNMVVKHLYNRMNRPLEKTSRRFNHFMGKKVHGQLAKTTGIAEPTYSGSMYYVAAGEQIVLKPDSTYRTIFCTDSTHAFTHHMLNPYYYLIQQEIK